MVAMAGGGGRPGLGALLCCVLQVQAVCQGPSVTQELLQEGFHRELLVQVELGEEAAGCAVAARTHLPPGIYVDPFELEALQQHNGTRALLSPAAVDVEAPEYVARGVSVVLFLRQGPRCPRCLQASLPLHLRYHRPALGTGGALLLLHGPELLLCCCHRQPAAECWEPAEVGAPCSAGDTGPGQWHSSTHTPAREELVLEVPVGLREHSSLVCALTLLTTLLCAALILCATCQHGHFSSGTCSQ